MNKKILISLGVIAVLGLYILISGRQWFSSVPDLAWNDKPDEIIITGADTSVRIHYRDNRWLLEDAAYPAETSAVENILSKMKDFEIVDLISEQGHYEKYGLAPGKHAEVRIKKDGAVFRTVRFGKKSPTNRHTFVTVDDRKEIYLASGVFDGILNKTADQLREKTIFSISKEAVASFEVSSRGRTFFFEKKKAEEAAVKDAKKDANSDPKETENKKVDNWVCRGYDGVGLDRSRIEQFLGAFEPLKAAAFPDMKKESLGRPAAVIRISAFNAETVLSLFGKDSENRYIATSSASPYVFTIDEWKAKKMFIDSLDAFKVK